VPAAACTIRYDCLCMLRYCACLLAFCSFCLCLHSTDTQQDKVAVPNAMGSLSAAPGGVRAGEPITKPACDKLAYRVVQLPNNLRIMLIHDPETDKAAAALDVSVLASSSYDCSSRAVQLFTGYLSAQPLAPPCSRACSKSCCKDGGMGPCMQSALHAGLCSMQQLASAHPAAPPTAVISTAASAQITCIFQCRNDPSLHCGISRRSMKGQ
jgi:hypothetical protein